jgi:predicted phosphodiesterase
MENAKLAPFRMATNAERPIVVVSDVHLSDTCSLAPGSDLARLLRSHPDHEVVMAGDLFDLSVSKPDDAPATLARLLFRHTEVKRALEEHVRRGAPLSIVAGNHDAALASDASRSALLDALGLAPDAPVTVSPWFVRRGALHIEHGHLYDPDNAPVHPLAPWSTETEPLGIALTRRFLAPGRALEFAHAHETTPLGGLIRCFQLFGARAPVLVLRYFATAIALCARAAQRPGVTAETTRGDQALDDFAADAGVDRNRLEELVRGRLPPTHLSLRETFMRLYFDRVIATLALAGGAAVAATTRSALAALIAAGSGAYLAGSVLRSGSRYVGLTETRLRDAAGCVALATGAKLVVFGHSHRLDEASRYVNSGSFGYPGRRARPFLIADASGGWERRELALQG